MVDNSTTRNGLCRSSTHGRFVESVPMRQNGKRHGMWPPTRPGRCWSNHPFDPSAQPRCGCCEHPPHTRGSAGNGATPGFMHNAFGVAEGEPRMDVDGMGVDGRGPISPSGNAQGRAIAVSPPGIRRSHLAPSSLRESQRDSAIKPGVAPPRRYPGSRPHRVPYPARGCAARARRWVRETRAE